MDKSMQGGYFQTEIETKPIGRVRPISHFM